MSAHDSSSAAEPHEGPIKTPSQLIWAVALSFIVPIIVIVLLVNYVTSAKKTPPGSDAFAAEAVAARIQPVGKVSLKEAGAAGALRTGQEVYAQACTACHAAGVAGAPKSGDAAAWAPRIKTGYEALLNSALKGKGAMAAQGGGQFQDIEVGRAVVYMVNQAGGKMDEPKAPASAAPAAASTTAPAAAPAAPAAAAAVPAAVVPPPPVAVAAAGATTEPPALYKQACTVCHAAGVAGAPKTGDKASWAPRIGQGIDALTANTIKGKGAMPPRGGSQATDAQIREVVAYMVNSAK
jgi:cytochrome c5